VKNGYQLSHNGVSSVRYEPRSITYNIDFSETGEQAGDGLNNKAASIFYGDGKVHITGGFTQNGSGDPLEDVGYLESGTWEEYAVIQVGNYPNEGLFFNSELYVVGGFFSPYSRAAKWNGSSWEQVGDGLNGTILSMTVKDDIYVGGGFTTSVTSGNTLNYVAKLENGEWKGVGGGFNDNVWDITNINGELYACGDFTQNVSGETVRRISKLNTTLGKWEELGNGINNGQAYTIVEYLGDIYVGGSFTNYLMKLNTQTNTCLF